MVVFCSSTRSVTYVLALDGIHEAEPDLFHIGLAAGDRILLCSDGASGVLDDGRLADILSTGGPDFAAVELVRASLEAGSSDNVTCIVADVVGRVHPDRGPPSRSWSAPPPSCDGAPAAPRAACSAATAPATPASSSRSPPRSPTTSPFAISSDPIDPEQARYAPRPPRRFVVAQAAARRADRPRPGLDRPRRGLVVEPAAVLRRRAGRHRRHLPRPERRPARRLAVQRPTRPPTSSSTRLSDFDAGKVREGIDAGSLDDARRTVDNLASKQSSDTSAGG